MDKKLTFITILCNTFLFVGKIIAGISYNSISLISDAINSLTDIFASITVYVSIIFSRKNPDKDHPFGHERFEPIAALVIAIIMIFLGIQIILNSTIRLISNEKLIVGKLPLIVSLCVILTKAILYLYSKIIFNKSRSVAIKAQMIDHRNDVLIGFSVFIGIFFANRGYNYFDGLIGLLIGIIISHAGILIMKENLGYTTGKSPPQKIYDDIHDTGLKIKGVIDVHHIKAQLLGTVIQTTFHISVDKNMTIKKAHDIAEKVGKLVEKIPDIESAYIHVDPYEGKTYPKSKR